jgi:hypothetical protein
MQEPAPQTFINKYFPKVTGLVPGNKLGKNNQGNPVHSPSLEITQMAILALTGLTLGIGVDAFFGYFFQKTKNKFIKFFMAFVQLATLIAVTYLMYTKLPESFTGTFQGTYPGMMFGIFFYGTQNNMFDGFRAVIGNIMG